MFPQLDGQTYVFPNSAAKDSSPHFKEQSPRHREVEIPSPMSAKWGLSTPRLTVLLLNDGFEGSIYLGKELLPDFATFWAT